MLFARLLTLKSELQSFSQDFNRKMGRPRPSSEVLGRSQGGLREFLGGPKEVQGGPKEVRGGPRKS